MQETDPFEACPEYSTHSKGDFHVHFEHYNSCEVPGEVLEWVVNMTHKSIGHLYDQTWGWDAEKKFEELAHVRF